MPGLDEIREIERIVTDLKDLARAEVIARAGPERLPVYKVSFGNPDPKAPVLGLVGGVHGLERIGAQVTVALLNSFAQLSLWDHNTQDLLRKIRVFFIPTLNPWGILHVHRCNENGVDLMRNAPVEALGKTTWLLAGQRYSKHLPWYRGDGTSGLEPEARALVEHVEAEMREAPVAITVDFHSGFGLQDRVWFPYAKTEKPFPDLPLMHSFNQLLERTYPYHFYRIEPQALNYTTHGDLWDYLYDRHRERRPGVPYLPLCIEMGSWNWVKKNPFQFFSANGPFNPVKRHRLKRVLRRHNTFFEFLLRAIASPDAWTQLNAEQTAAHGERAMKLWYAGKGSFSPEESSRG